MGDGHDETLERLVLEKQRLRALPPELARLTRLTSLRIRSCASLASLAGIEALTSLESVELCDLPALDLDDACARLGELPGLGELTLGGASLTRLPESLAGLGGVRVVTLDRCEALDLDRALAVLARLDALRVLDASSNRFTALPKSIGRLAQLTHLDLGRNQLRSLPPELCRLTGLEVLDLSWNRALKKLPAKLGDLRALQALDLEWTNIAELPASCVHLLELRRLVAGEKLTTVPPGFFDAIRFESVKLPPALSAQARFRPIETAHLEELELVRAERVSDDLGDPRIVRVALPTLDAPLVALSRMRRVEVAELALPPALLADALARLATAPALRRLHVRGKPGVLPDAVGELAALQELNVTGCGVPVLPSSIGRLARLRVLYLGENPLATLPDELAGLSQLANLELAQTGLDALPRWIGELAALERLDLRGLPLRELPDELAGLTRLATLDLLWRAHAPPAVLGRLSALRALTYERRGEHDWSAFFRVVAACPLEELQLRTGQLETLPPELRALRHLRHLDLSFARLRRVPRELVELPALRYLRVDHDFLESGERVVAHLGEGWTRTDRGPTISTYQRR